MNGGTSSVEDIDAGSVTVKTKRPKRDEKKQLIRDAGGKVVLEEVEEQRKVLKHHRNPASNEGTWYLADANELFKAAFHDDKSGTKAVYFNYSTGSNIAPIVGKDASTFSVGDMTIEPGVKVTGKVTIPDRGTNVFDENDRFSIWSTSVGAYAPVVLNPDGRFEFQALDGDVVGLHYHKSDYRSRYTDEQEFHEIRPNMSPLEIQSFLDLEGQGEGESDIRGRVVDAKGKPIPKAKIKPCVDLLYPEAGRISVNVTRRI